MTRDYWRVWRDRIASTFDLDAEEEERLRESFDEALRKGVRHGLDVFSDDDQATATDALEAVGL